MVTLMYEAMEKMTDIFVASTYNGKRKEGK